MRAFLTIISFAILLVFNIVTIQKAENQLLEASFMEMKQDCKIINSPEDYSIGIGNNELTDYYDIDTAPPIFFHPTCSLSIKKPKQLKIYYQKKGKHVVKHKSTTKKICSFALHLVRTR